MSVTINPKQVKLLMPQKMYLGDIQLITPIHIGVPVILREKNLKTWNFTIENLWKIIDIVSLTMYF